MDLENLQHHFDVKPLQWTRTRDIKNILRVMWHIYRTDVSFIWFAGGHASRVVFFSKLFRKKSIVVVGGYEVADVPEISYGLMISPKYARKVKCVLKNADKLLAVSEFTKEEILIHFNSTNLTVIYNGVDIDKFNSDESKEDIIITVGSKIKLKGLDTFIKSARLLPRRKFIIIGLSDDAINYLKPSKPANVELIGLVSHETILRYYQRAKVYCQLSYRESFGMALAEAMACRCVPVVTDNAALPEVVGGTGFYVSYGDPEATAEAIEKALQSDGEDARERVKRLFPIESREKKLVQIIKEMI